MNKRHILRSKGGLKMELKIGQTWVSEESPHESFRIYDGFVDSTCDSIKDFNLPFDEQPESSKIFFWERLDRKIFLDFVKEKKGENFESTYPYAWCGESKKNTLVAKIKKHKMKLLSS
jgi:hypothetical protein